MPYTDPVATFAAGQKLTAAQLNTYLRDNLAFLARPPACSILADSGVAIATGSPTIISGTSENYDWAEAPMHSNVTNPSRITAQVAGIYLAGVTISYVANGTGNRQASLIVNGTTVYEGDLVPAATGNSTACHATRTLELAVGDYVETRALQSSGGNLSTTLNEFFLFFQSFA